MSKTKKPIPRINQVFAKLVNDRGKQVDAAKELNTSSQSIGYYMKGRKIPPEVIARVADLWGVNLITASQEGANIETIVSRETKSDAQEEEAPMTIELWRRLQKDHDLFEKELDRAWRLIDRLIPPAHGVERVTSKDG